MTEPDTSPKDKAMGALDDAVAGLQEAHDGADNAAEAGAAEHKHVSAFVDTVAKALAEGMNEPVGLFAGAVADETQYYTKSDLKQQIKDRTEDLRGSDKEPLDEFVADRLEEVVVVKTTDHRQGAEYIWDFGTFKVETESGKDGRGHFLFPQFRNLIHESGGVNAGKPTKDRRGGEEWRDFMIDMIDDRGQEQYTRGPRTEAFEALRNKIKRLTGYGTPEGAVNYTGVWVIRVAHDIPDWWQYLGETPPDVERDLPEGLVQEVRVHESVIEPVLEDAGITRSAFYHELKARNLTVPGTSGASMMQWVNGSDERFWTFLPDVATPRTYVPDPHAGEQTHTGSLFAEPDAGASSSAVASAATDGGQSSENSSDDESDDDGFDSVGDVA